MAKHGLQLKTKKECRSETVATKGLSNDKKENPQLSTSSSKVSNKLLETIEKRRLERSQFKPKGRRGRKPKNMGDYTPQHNDYDNFTVENDYGGLEYDTGIKVNKAVDDHGSGFERGEGFDEELNFDR